MKASTFFENAIVNVPVGLIENPKVSVILPTYARCQSGLLKRAIDSVLAQSFSSFELIIMDDGSTDGTSELIAEIQSYDNRVIHVRHDDNCGMPALRVNEGLLMARGEYCAYQFDDDRWTEQALEKLVNALDTNPDVGLVYGKTKLKTPVDQDYNYSLGEEFSYEKIVATNYIANNSVLHRREVFELFGGYDMNLIVRRLCDWDLWRRWSEKVAFLFVDEDVSIVDAAMEGSLGTTLPLDTISSRAYMALDRNNALTPKELPFYEVDKLSHLDFFSQEHLIELWHKFVAPFQAKFINYYNKVERPKFAQKTKKLALVVKGFYDATVTITVDNYKHLVNDDYHFVFIPEQFLDSEWLKYSDIVLLVRVYGSQSKTFIEEAIISKIPTVYIMDDDLFKLYTIDDKYAKEYSLDGSNMRGIIDIVEKANLVFTYSELQSQSAVEYNNKVFKQKTSIKKSFLPVKPSPINNKLKIAFSGGDARVNELNWLKTTLIDFAQQYSEKIELYFLGYTPDFVEQLNCSVTIIPWSFNYYSYMESLSELGINFLLSPLFDTPFKNAKCPIKLLEATVAGAVGVFSKQSVYKEIPDSAAFIVENTIESWNSVLETIATASKERVNTYWQESLRLVKRDYTAESQSSRFKAGLELAKLKTLSYFTYITCVVKNVDTMRADEILVVSRLRSLGLKVDVIAINLTNKDSNNVRNSLKNSSVVFVFDDLNIECYQLMQDTALSKCIKVLSKNEFYYENVFFDFVCATCTKTYIDLWRYNPKDSVMLNLNDSDYEIELQLIQFILKIANLADLQNSHFADNENSFKQTQQLEQFYESLRSINGN